MANILITGGAGFIGTHLCRSLAGDHKITVLDNLLEQVHGKNPVLEIRDIKNVNLVVGDVCDDVLLKDLLKDKEYVIHLASETGTGQSMYEIQKYSNVNILGTTSLISAISSLEIKPKKVILSSSRAVYGEGKYYCYQDKKFIYPICRNQDDMLSGKFDPTCNTCGNILSVVETDESSKLNPTSFYGLTKKIQEDVFSYFHKTTKIPTIILRFQNVYGPGQSLNNPYTGVLSIFYGLMFQNKDVNIFEDGKETRDFVYVDDVVNAIILSMNSNLNYEILNVGTGRGVSIFELAKLLKNKIKSNSRISISGNFRVGDIRHNISDINGINQKLNYNPQVKIEDGVEKFIEWAKNQKLNNNNLEKSFDELKERGLLK